MSLVSVEEAAATRRSWREDVQWNIARRKEAFRLAGSITGETLANSIARLYFAYSNAAGSGVDGRWSKYHKELCQLAEQNKSSLLSLRKLWKALDELPKKPTHLTGWGNAGASFQRVISMFMRAVFAAEMGLQLTRHVRRERGWPRKLNAGFCDHDFTFAPKAGAVAVYGWEPYWPPSDGGARLQATAGALDLECAILPATMGMWFPGRTVPIVFYQRQGIYRPNIEAGIERMVQELGR